MGITAGFIFDPKTFLLIKKKKEKRKNKTKQNKKIIMFVSPKSKHTLPPKSKLKSLLSNTLTQNEGNYLQLQVQALITCGSPPACTLLHPSPANSSSPQINGAHVCVSLIPQVSISLPQVFPYQHNLFIIINIFHWQNFIPL